MPNADGNPQDAATFYLDRVQRLGEVLESVTSDRDLAVLRAHEHGAAHEEIARRASLPPAEVSTVVASLLTEEDIADWCDGPDYLPVWRNYR